MDFERGCEGMEMLKHGRSTGEDLAHNGKVSRARRSEQEIELPSYREQRGRRADMPRGPS